MTAVRESAWAYDVDVRLQSMESAPVSGFSASADEVRGLNLRPINAPSPPRWAGNLVTRMQELIRGGHLADAPVKNVVLLVRFLQDPIFQGTPMPFVSASEIGGISAEFRAEGVELHVGFDDAGTPVAYVFQAPGTEWEGPLAEVPDGIDKWAWRLAQGIH